MLNPNCSECVWRLDIPLSTKEKILKELDEEEEEEIEIHTDDGEKCLSEMISQLAVVKNENIDKVNLNIIENQASDYAREYVEQYFEIAKMYKNGEITLKKAKELEDVAFR